MISWSLELKLARMGRVAEQSIMWAITGTATRSSFEQKDESRVLRIYWGEGDNAPSYRYTNVIEWSNMYAW